MFGKIFTLFVALLGLLSMAEAGYASDKCRRKNPDAYNGILQFCQNKQLVSPSQYANDGVFTIGYGTHVWISSGLCLIPQWIPQFWCRTQFMRTCADGGPFGGTNPMGRRFGRGGCQYYHIKPHYTWNKN